MNLLSKEKLKLKALQYGLKFLLAVPIGMIMGPVVAAGIFIYREFSSSGVKKISEEQKKSLQLEKNINGQKIICLQASEDNPVNIALQDICKKMNEEKPALFITLDSLAHTYPNEHIEISQDIVSHGDRLYRPVLAHEIQHQKLYSAREKANRSYKHTRVFNLIAGGVLSGSVAAASLFDKAPDYKRACFGLLTVGAVQMLSKIFHRAAIQQEEYVCDLAAADITGRGMALARFLSEWDIDAIRKVQANYDYSRLTSKSDLWNLTRQDNIKRLALRFMTALTDENTSRKVFNKAHDLLNYNHPPARLRIRKLISYQFENSGLSFPANNN